MIISFKCQPDMSALPEHNKAVLVQDWFFTIDDKTYWIPKDYFYNGASIPRPFWPIVGSPFQPDLWAPALAHDWLYLTHLVSRKVADEALYQLMIQNKVNTIRAHTIWAAVRSCAGFAWKNSKEDDTDLTQIRFDISKRPDKEKFFLI